MHPLRPSPAQQTHHDPEGGKSQDDGHPSPAAVVFLDPAAYSTARYSAGSARRAACRRWRDRSSGRDRRKRPARDRAAALVGRDLGLEPGWLNAGPTGLLELGLPAGLTDRLIARDYGPALRVSFASRIDQIFFKLYAAADRREPRDLADLGVVDDGRDA